MCLKLMFKLQNTRGTQNTYHRISATVFVTYKYHRSILSHYYFKLNVFSFYICDKHMWIWLWYRESLEHCEILISPNTIPRLNDSELIARSLRGIIYFKLIDSRLHEAYTHSPRLRYIIWITTLINSSLDKVRPLSSNFICTGVPWISLHALNENDTRL